MASNTYSRIHQKIAPCSQAGGTRMRATCPAFHPSPLFLSLSPLAILRSFLLTSCPFPELLISLWARHSNHRCLPLSFYMIVRLLFSSNVPFFISLMSRYSVIQGRYPHHRQFQLLETVYSSHICFGIPSV